MPTFTYTARTKSGERTQGSVDANDKRAALRLIEDMGCFPISVKEGASDAPAKAKPAAKKRLKFERKGGRRMGTSDVLLFSTELSDLLGAGMTLGNGLNLLAHRETGRASDEIIPQLRDEILRGASLSAALAKHPKSFPSLYVTTIRAGEASGALSEVLKRLVEHYERMQEIRDKLLTALLYPVILLVMGVGVVLFTVMYVIPKFKDIFEDLGATLPLSTRMLMGMSTWLVSYGWIIAAVLVILAVLAYRAVQTERGRLWWHGLLLKLPLVKGVLSSGLYANFSRTLATLLFNGVPVLQALSIVEQTMTNAVIAREIHSAREKVTDGTTISGPLAAGKVFPQMMTDMLAVGEQTGNVVGSLGHVARRYENQLDRSIRILTTALEPIMIIIIAIGVGFVAVSIVSAVFSLTSGLDTPM